MTRSGNYLVESKHHFFFHSFVANHQTLHDSLGLFQQVINVTSTVNEKLSFIRSLLANTQSASRIDSSGLTESVKTLETKQNIVKILSTLETMNELLTKADNSLAMNNISDCWDTLVSLKRQFALAESQSSFENLSHFTELKQKAAKIKKDCGQQMQNILQTCSIDPARHEDTQVLQCITILTGKGDDFSAVYESLFSSVKKTIRSAVTQRINSVLTDIPIEKSFLQSRPKEMNEIIHVFNSFENKMLGQLFATVSDYLFQLVCFLQNLLEIGQFTSRPPFSLDDIIAMITEELLTVTSCFTRQSATSNISFYLEENGTENRLDFKPNMSLFNLPDFLLIHNVDFSKSLFYQKMLTKDEPNLLSFLSQSTVKLSIEALCSRIAPKNSFYTNIFTELFKFVGRMKKRNENVPASIADFQKKIESFYCTSFLSSLQTKITNCINASFGLSSSFDPILVGSELDQIFKLIPELCNMFNVLSLCVEHSKLLNENCAGFISSEISPSSIAKDSFVKIMSKFESLFNFLFSERTKATQHCCSNLIVTKIINSNNFFLALDQQVIDSSVVKKEFYSIFDFKKGRSFRKDELLEQTKIEKILLLYRSLLWFQQAIKSNRELTELLGKLDLLIFKIIYSLRIETMIQSIYYLELILFDKNENVLYFVNQLVSFLALLDSQCIKVIGPKGNQFLWKGIGQFFGEFFTASSKQISTGLVAEGGIDENLKTIQRMVQHCIFNLCCNETIE